MNKIYKITNSLTQEIYVGITKGTLEKRFKRHCYTAKKHECPTLFESAINEYGHSAFTLEVIEDNLKDRKLALLREKFWIATFKERGFVLYNSTNGGEDGEHTFEGRLKISQRTKEAMSDPALRKHLSDVHSGKKRGPHSQEHRDKISAANKGKTLSLEQRKKISNSISGSKHPLFGLHIPESTKKKMSESNRKAFHSLTFEEKKARSEKIKQAVLEKSEMISERTKAAMHDPIIRARHLEGCKKNRALNDDQEKIVVELLRAGFSVKSIARKMEVSTTPIFRIRDANRIVSRRGRPRKS